MSSANDDINEISLRLNKIENDEYISAKRLYDHTLTTFYIAGFLVAAVFSVITATQLFSIYGLEKRIDNLITDARSEIDKLTGENLFQGYRIEYKKDEDGYLVLYERRSLNDGIISLDFAAPIEVYGTSNNYGKYKGATFRLGIKNFIDAIKENMESDFEKNLFEAKSEQLFSDSKEAYVNKMSGISVVLTYSMSIGKRYCARIEKMRAALTGDNKTGSFEFTPIIINEKGSAETTTIPFRFYLQEQKIDCSLLD